MARQGSHSRSHRDPRIGSILRSSLLASVWLCAVGFPVCIGAEDQPIETAAGLLSVPDSNDTSTNDTDTIDAEVIDAAAKKIHLVSGTSLRTVQANEKMPWVFNVQSTSNSDKSLGSEQPVTAGDSLTLRYSIHRVDLGHRVLSGRREMIAAEPGQTQTISLDDRAPKEEGVYEVRFQLVRRSDKLWARLRPKEIVLEELRVPMLVQLPPSVASAHPTPWQTIGEIRPSDTAMALGQWLPNSAARLIPGVRHVKGNLQKGQADGESVSIVQPKSVFQAKLPIMAAGYPHRITIRCPRDQASGLRLDLGHGDDQTQSRFSSLVQSHDALSLRKPTAYKQEGIVPSADSESRSDDQWLTRTYLYYPQPDDQIWLTNLNDSSTVAFESVEVTAGPSTSMGLTPRRAVAEPTTREIVMSIFDPAWIQTWTEDWQAVGESAACESRSIELHRIWLAAHRAIEQAQQLRASSLSIPITPTDPTSLNLTLGNLVADKETVALQVFDRFEIGVKPSVSFNGNQAGSLEQITGRLKEYRCVDGLIVSIDQPFGVTENALGILRRVSRTKQLLLRMTTASLDEKTQKEIASIDGVVFVTNFDYLGSVRPASDFSKTGSPTMTGVALVDHPIVRQDPAASLFEIIHRSNPSVVIFSASVARGIVDDRLSRTCKSYEALPADSMMQIAALDSGDGTCRVSRAVVQDRVLISISNLAPWDSIVKLESVGPSNDSPGTKTLLSDTVLWERVDDGSFASKNGSTLIQGLNIPARDTVLLRSRFPVPQSAQDGIESWRWSAQVAGGDSVIDQIKKDVTGIVERMGMLSDPASNDQLNNGSFETVGEMGLVGWLHAQHPPGCVVVDSEEASDGIRSVRLKTDQAVSARTWLVSDTIDVPASGRLAVSMALRGESLPADDLSEMESAKVQGNLSKQTASSGSVIQNSVAQPSEQTQHLRVSLEATQSGSAMRKSADVKIHRSGNWQPRRIVLEVDSIDPSTTDTLRLTIDSMTPGLIWVDDIQLHDDFSTARERSDLQTQAFLAVEGLQRGNLTPSAKLLMNRWASHLLGQAEQAERLSEKSSLPRESAKSSFSKVVPEVANRNRAWLLERLRF